MPTKKVAGRPGSDGRPSADPGDALIIYLHVRWPQRAVHRGVGLCYDAIMWQSGVFWVGVGYLCGSAPFAWLIGKAKGVDIRTVGSGNVGATNVGRALGRRWGVLCLVLDMLKGAVPVLAAGWVMGYIDGDPFSARGDAWWWSGVAAAAVMGHVFPVWLRFRGGKGVATAMGAMLGLWPIVTLATVAAILVWLVMVKAWGYVSLASITAVTSLPLCLWGIAQATGRSNAEVGPFLLISVLLAGLVILRHRTNVARLLAGTEPRVSSKIDPPTPG